MKNAFANGLPVRINTYSPIGHAWLAHAKAGLVCAVLAALLITFASSQAQAVAPVVKALPDNGPALDMAVLYYNRVLTQDGVVRETRYEEEMMRRPGHVWVSRVRPSALPAVPGLHQAAGGVAAKKISAERNPAVSGAKENDDAEREHKHFNYLALERHVVRKDGKLQLEFIDKKQHWVVAIAPTEYDNVNFDGSWTNAFFLLDPLAVQALPLSKRASPYPDAHWREREKDGLFQRVLWDEKRMVPLMIETGDKAGTFFRSVEVKPQNGLSKQLPWQNLAGFAQKEYADFLD